MVFGFVHTLLFVAWHFETASTTHKRERNIWYPCMPYSSRVSFIGEEEKEEEEEEENLPYQSKHFNHPHPNIEIITIYVHVQTGSTSLVWGSPQLHLDLLVLASVQKLYHCRCLI